MQFPNAQSLVNAMKAKERTSKQQILGYMKGLPTLVEKCVFARQYLAPQSTDMERVIMNDLKLQPPLNETSGDATKSGVRYEIKYSGHARESKLNFVQIRPDHTVDKYLLFGYNMYSQMSNIGEAHMFVIPAEVMYDMIIQYGGYAHGTCRRLGEITSDTIKGRNCEYALRVNPNAREGTKDHCLWKWMKQFERPYTEESLEKEL